MTQPAARYSPLGLAGLALDHVRLLIFVPLAALVLSAGFTLALGGDYAASASFTPQVPKGEAARLSGLASQFGVNLGGLSSEGESVDFYARLAKSRALLEHVAQAEYSFAKREGSGEKLEGTLIELLEIRGETPAEQLLAAVKTLDRMVAVGLDLDANVVTITTTAPWAGLAEQINRKLLDEVNRFNLQQRQSHAAAERRFVEQQITRAQADLDAAEQELGTFLQHNRRYEEWPQLRFEAAKLQRRVDLRQQVYTTLAQRLEQARVDEVRNTPVITIIDSPEGSAHREASLVKNGVLSMIVGFGLVIGFLFMREYGNRLRSEHPDDYARIRERSRALLPARRLRNRRLPFLLLPLLLPALHGCDDSLTEPDAPAVFTAVATGGEHSCALTESGTGFCWGRGTDGELGNGGSFSTAVPVKVASAQPLTAITAGTAHSCALGADGRAYCWGLNTFYQRGNAYDPAANVPVAVTGERSYTAISAGAHHTCALTAAGEVWCWGYNRFGQLGDGTTNTSVEPVAVAGSRRFRAVAAGAWHTCAIGTDDRAYCWGRNDQAQLGVGSDLAQTGGPVPVAGDLRFSAISAGTNHSCGVVARRAYCWGGNEHGQIGDGSAQPAGLPGAVRPGLAAEALTFVRVEAGSYVTCGLTEGGAAVCWGRGGLGQIGSGEDFDQYRPQNVELHAEGALRFVQLAPGGATHACGISTGRALYCWGAGTAGQLGSAKQTTSYTPLRVRAPAGAD